MTNIASDKFDVDFVNLESLTIIKASIENQAGLSALPRTASSEIKFQLVPGVNWDLNKVRMSFECQIKVFKNDQNTEELNVSGSFEIAYVFFIENLHKIATWSEQSEEKEVIVPGDLVSSLSNIAYSTSRGVIFTRCLGTVLGNVILPVLSTDRILGKGSNE